jgi:conjugative transposon protein TcpC
MMASGNRVLPEAPLTIERVTAEQHMMAARGTGTAGTANLAGQQTGNAAGQAIDQPQRIARRGAGGRWLVWMLRAIVWVVLLLIGYRGIVAIVTGYQSQPSASTASQNPDGFPVQLGDAFALEFGQVYLNFSPATAAQRASELAPFLPSGTDPQLGWNGNGSQTVQSEQVAGIEVSNAHSAVVKLLAVANGQLIEVGVPVYYANGGIVVSGQPALLAPPPGLILPPAAKITPDRPAETALTQALPAFFRAFAASSTTGLSPFTTPGTQLTGLGGEVTFGSIQSVTVPVSSGPVKHITVTVDWLPASTPSAGPSTSAGGRAQLQMSYAMTVVERGGHWFVSSIGASTALPGSAP